MVIFFLMVISWARTLTSRVFKGSPTPDSNSECQIRHRVSALYSRADWGLWEPKWLWYGLDLTHCPDRRLADTFSCLMSRFNSADFLLSCIKVCNLFIIFIFFIFCETRLCHVPSTRLEMWPSSYLSILSAEITGTCHQACLYDSLSDDIIQFYFLLVSDVSGVIQCHSRKYCELQFPEAFAYVLI